MKASPRLFYSSMRLELPFLNVVEPQVINRYPPSTPQRQIHLNVEYLMIRLSYLYIYISTYTAVMSQYYYRRSKYIIT
jgi:hypothetical protein